MKLTEKEIKTIKENAIEIPVKYGDDISNILKKLVQLHNDGYYNYYVEIYGNKYYSVDVDYERDFKSIVGISENELNEIILEEQEKANKEKDRLEKDAKDNLNRRINDGKKYIIKAKQCEWERKVIQYSEALYNSALDYIIKYLELLHNTDNVKDIANQYFAELPYSTTDWYQMRILCEIAIFSNKGLEFFREIINLALKGNMHVSNPKQFINFLKKVNTYIKQGVDYEKAESLSKQKAIKLIIRDELLKEKMISYEIIALQNDNHLIGIDQAGNLFIAEIINNSDFHGYIINLENQEKTYIRGEINQNNVVAFTAQSELLDFSQENNETGILTIEIIPSRRKLIPIDNSINNAINRFNPVILTRIYNQFAIESIKIYNEISEKNFKKKLNP